MTSVSESLVQDLEEQHQQMMMKKLLFAACRNYWETDHITLLSTDTSTLVRELRESYPTLAEVKGKLEQVVSNLNKPDKYYPIANKLVGKISKLYGEALDHSPVSVSALESPETTMNAPLTKSSQLTNIVHEFEHDRTSQRIHKMLFALSKQRWENNYETLSQYPLQQLVQEVHQNYSDLERLALSLLKILKGLNKQRTYSKVSQSIIAQFAKLYKGEIDVEPLQSLVDLSKQSSKQCKTTETHASTRSHVGTETRKHNLNYNPYQLRQRVMKYTNPLRVKMLLYYTLNSSSIETHQEADGLLLKTYELDKMLMEIVREYKTLQELQDNLEATALGISSLRNKMSNVDENLQVAKAIVMSVKPIYLEGGKQEAG